MKWLLPYVPRLWWHGRYWRLVHRDDLNKHVIYFPEFNPLPWPVERLARRLDKATPLVWVAYR